MTVVMMMRYEFHAHIKINPMPTSPPAYEINNQAASAQDFIAIACDPQRSVVVQACAGSGKTWLLVGRMLRLLLAGAEPASLLAITFTRKAAQEMRERLMQLLHELALGSDQQVTALLLERAVVAADLPRLVPVARGLYARVLASPQALSIDTFHSWFLRLLQIAPLASEVPHGYVLSENSSELIAKAYRSFMQNDVKRPEIKDALLRLYDMVGDFNAKGLLDAFVSKRAEWWAATHLVQDGQPGMPLEWLQALCGRDAQSDARLTLWQDAALIQRIQNIASLLGKGTATNQKRATAIEMSMTAAASLESFNALYFEFFSADGVLRKNAKTKNLTAAIEQAYGQHDGLQLFDDEFTSVAEALKKLQQRSSEPDVIALNAALFTAGSAYLLQYQSIKAEQRVLDFADLEWHAYRLLMDEEHAAYLHSRLDARYQHILLDEFQDTNPLQWHILRSWLEAYGAQANQPSVFIVGDPKQSIYRFRRAEPRVFDAASALLAEQGAVLLRTNQTRRNAPEIIASLNTCFVEKFKNDHFFAHTTLQPQSGAVWRLPLIEQIKQQPANEEGAGLRLRDPFNEAREEEDDTRRYEEGLAVAQAITQAKLTCDASWSDVMLLVKKRKHLVVYERALRAAGIPFVSDKPGGLLTSLEVADLIALLRFLMTPENDVCLAQVLKSPIMEANDEDLIALALRKEKSWWQRLQVAAEDTTSINVALLRAASLLTKWLRVAPFLPVHDLLDMILYDGELIARYAQAAPAMMRSQVIGNIEAFIALSLNMDGGRYPSLPRFLDALRVLQNGIESDAPDEAQIDATIDAVRILTIHSAKGLEAPIVVLLDANHSKPARDDSGILCHWPPDAIKPLHFSAFGRKDARGAARDALFAEEETYKLQEDKNLLYVAMTRAKRVLIISGVAEAGKAAAEGDDHQGIVSGSWYDNLQHIPVFYLENVSNDIDHFSPEKQDAPFRWPIFNPPLMPAISVVSSTPDDENTAAIEEGIALHALMERLTQSSSHWPITTPAPDIIARSLPCPLPMAKLIHQQALTILSRPDLARFYDPSQYTFARNEMEMLINQQTLRVDRLVILQDVVWILDYKRQFLESERADYQAQLQRYREACLAIFPGKTIRTAVITVDGVLWEINCLFP